MNDTNSNLNTNTNVVLNLDAIQTNKNIQPVQQQSTIVSNNNKKKTILYLINGLGVASKNSFGIDYGNIMPNMSMLMGNYLYTNLLNVNYNYKSGFRTFSLGNDLLPTYHKLENDTELGNNKVINDIAKDVLFNHTRLHIFCFLDNDQVVKQVIKLINVLVTKGNFMIYIHIILRQKDVVLYEEIIERIKKVDDSITLLPNVKIGVISGERKVNGDSYYTLISKENGEKWPDYGRKLRFVADQDIKPIDSDPFYMNQGFKLQRNDISLFLNYEDVDCDLFISKIPYVKLYTLFPMKSYSYAINIYDELEPPTYFSKTLEENDIKCLILTSEDRIPSINYNLCGLKDEKSLFITYGNVVKHEDINKLIEEYDYIIYDYDIARFTEIRRLKEFLMHIDDEINDVYNMCEQNDYKFIISSLYGIYKTFLSGVDKEVLLDYSTEVPAIIIDSNLPRAKFMFKYGNTNKLSNTIFNLITDNESIDTAIRKRSILSYFKD